MIKEDLITAIDTANNTFKAIMDNYSDMKAYLVLSSPYGQFKLTDDPLQISHILKEFPAMISESEFKDKGIKLLETIQGLEVELKYAARGNMKAEIKKKIEKASLLLNANLMKIEFKDDTFIEIRFERPILDLIFEITPVPLTVE